MTNAPGASWELPELSVLQSSQSARSPSDEIIPYDLACVCCALKRFDEAREWLAKGIEVGGNGIKLKALDDPDIEPISEGTGET